MINFALIMGQFVAFIHGVIDWFYPPFRRIMPLQTFRYAACGGGNTILDICLFMFAHDVLLQGQLFHTAFLTLTAHIAAFLFSFLFTFPIGFFLNRYVVFQDASVRKREQLPKYLAVVLCAILLNYFCLKVFIETIHLHPLSSKLITTAIVIAFTYYSQRHFTFKQKPDSESDF